MTATFPRNCQYCGADFITSKAWKMFCDGDCLRKTVAMIGYGDLTHDQALTHLVRFTIGLSCKEPEGERHPTVAQVLAGHWIIPPPPLNRYAPKGPLVGECGATA